MAMEINGSYPYAQTNYAEKLKEKQSLDKPKKAEETKSEQNEKNAPEKTTAQDAYISSEKSGEKPSGLYRLERDENGNPKIIFDDPKKTHSAEKTAQEDKNSAASKVNADDPKKSVEQCTGDTGKVDREIEKLKEKKKQLEQQIQSAAGDEKKIQELEQKLAQVENELSQKDNETYRRQNTIFS